MDSGDSERARELAEAARERDQAGREAFIRAAAAGDSEIETEAITLLGEPEQSGSPEPRQATTRELAPGAILNARYLIVRELNRGGFGVVYLAHDQQLHGKPVVVKIQREALGDDPWFERKFAEEIRALAMIDHPGVVGALDSGKTADGRPFLVMQYVDGRSLRSVIPPEGLALDRAASILRQTGQALNAAHEKRIWHRDLKPENIMLQSLPGGEEHVRLIDFGIATIADLRASRLRTATRLAGSLCYMAPEQMAGQPCEATDTYAFGVIAYEMVTGRKPFIPEDVVQLHSLQRAGVRIKPIDLRPGLPLMAQKLILQSLSYNPKDRPVNAGDFGERLAQALTLESHSLTAGHKATGAGKRRVIMVTAAVAGLAAVGVGAWFSEWRFKSEAISQPPPATVSQKPGTAAPGQLAVELEFWNSIRDENQPGLYRQYLSKYPAGQFTGLAKAKLEELARKPKAETPAAEIVAPKEAAPAHKPLPSPRPSLDPNQYYGPLKGELTWTGRLSAQGELIIQAGHCDIGSISGDLPRVPVVIDVPSGLSLSEPPAAENRWDRLALRNRSGKQLDSISISWRVVQ